nr:hypothetical protein [Tanacetum cinerariifolium]
MGVQNNVQGRWLNRKVQSKSGGKRIQSKGRYVLGLKDFMTILELLLLSKKGLGYESYHVVSPPPTGLFSPPKLDLSNFGLEEFKQPEFEGYGPKTCKNVSEDIPNELKEYPDAPLVKDRVSDTKDCSVESPVVVEKQTDFSTIAKVEFVRPKQQEKPVKKPVGYAEMYRS